MFMSVSKGTEMYKGANDAVSSSLSCNYSPPASNKLLLENKHNYQNLPIKYY